MSWNAFGLTRNEMVPIPRTLPKDNILAIQTHWTTSQNLINVWIVSRKKNQGRPFIQTTTFIMRPSVIEIETITLLIARPRMTRMLQVLFKIGLSFYKFEWSQTPSGHSILSPYWVSCLLLGWRAVQTVSVKRQPSCCCKIFLKSICCSFDSAGQASIQRTYAP